MCYTHLTFHLMYMQETRQLLQEIINSFREAARGPLTEKNARVMDVLLEGDLVGLVQKMWRQHLSEDLLKQEYLPSHIRNSLGVMHISHLYVRQ